MLTGLVVVSAAITLLLATLLITTVSSTFGQMDDQMEMNGNATTTNSTSASSPVTYNLTDSGVQLRLSWKPQAINTEKPTMFSFEFLDSDTGEHLSNVSYAVHMSLDGKRLGHGHNGTALEGIGTLEQKFDSMGSLSIIVESIKVGNAAPLTEFAQFNLSVVPEFPALFAGIIMSVILTSSVLTSKFLFSKA